jgi:hypothetical protein
MKRILLAAVLVSLCVSLGFLSGCTGSSAPPPVAVTIATANNQTTLEQGQSVAITATVTHATNTGVTFSLSGSACPNSCGSLSSATANPTTYTAPSSVSASFVVTVTATSSADATKTNAVTLTITPPISVSITNKQTTIQAASGAVTFNATVANDQNSQGVTWSAKSNGVDCTPTCGTLTNAAALSVTYTPPQDPPSPATVTLTATSKADNTKSDTDQFTITPHPIVVSITDKINSIVAGAAAVTFNATVAHDATGVGVTWTLTASNVPCSPTCGSLSNTAAFSVKYAPPASVPTAPNNAPTLTATSVADATKNDSDMFTVTAAPPISVTIQSKIANIQANTSATLNVMVQNDPANNGVTWTLTASGSNCSPTCGTLTNVTATSVTYNAPTSVPASPNNTPTITATSVSDNTKSDTDTFTITAVSAACPSGNETFLNGQYAFLVKGFDANGAVAIGGSFTADGAGKITAGEEDINRTTGVTPNSALNTASSSYTVGADNRGCLTLVQGTTTNVFRFALSSTAGLDPLARVDAVASITTAVKGRIIEFDDSTGTGTRGSGIIRKQDATSFAVTKISGNYAFGLTGSDSSGRRFGILGAFTANTGVFTTGSFDADDAGTLTTNAPITSQVYTVGSNGRGTLSVVAGGTTFTFALYMVSSSEILLVGTDPISPTNPLDSGEALQQQGTFSQSSLSGNFVLYLSGESGSGSSATSNTALVLGTVTSSGNATITIYEDNGGTSSTTPSQSGTYAVASNGRVTLSGFGGSTPVFYLVNQSEGFVGGTDNSVTFGFLEPQAAGPFMTSSLSGAFIAGNESPSDSGVSNETAAVNLDGSGNITGTQDKSDSSGLTPNNQLLGGTYAITNTNGTGTVGSNGILIVISSSRFVFVDEKSTNTNPKITVVEK